MSTVVIFDENATPQRVLNVIHSANTPDYSGRTDAVINPDLSLLGSVPIGYWKHVAGEILEYTQAEKDAQDAADTAASIASIRAVSESTLADFGSIGLLLRAFADIMKDEINTLRALHSLAPRTLAQLRTAITTRINDGSVDS